MCAMQWPNQEAHPVLKKLMQDCARLLATSQKLTRACSAQEHHTTSWTGPVYNKAVEKGTEGQQLHW